MKSFDQLLLCGQLLFLLGSLVNPKELTVVYPLVEKESQSDNVAQETSSIMDSPSSQPNDLEAIESRYKVNAKPEPYQPPQPAPNLDNIHVDHRGTATPIPASFFPTPPPAFNKVPTRGKPTAKPLKHQPTEKSKHLSHGSNANAGKVFSLETETSPQESSNNNKRRRVVRKRKKKRYPQSQSIIPPYQGLRTTFAPRRRPTPTKLTTTTTTTTTTPRPTTQQHKTSTSETTRLSPTRTYSPVNLPLFAKDKFSSVQHQRDSFKSVRAVPYFPSTAPPAKEYDELEKTRSTQSFAPRPSENFAFASYTQTASAPKARPTFAPREAFSPRPKPAYRTSPKPEPHSPSMPRFPSFAPKRFPSDPPRHHQSHGSSASPLPIVTTESSRYHQSQSGDRNHPSSPNPRFSSSTTLSDHNSSLNPSREATPAAPTLNSHLPQAGYSPSWHVTTPKPHYTNPTVQTATYPSVTPARPDASPSGGFPSHTPVPTYSPQPESGGYFTPTKPPLAYVSSPFAWEHSEPTLHPDGIQSHFRSSPTGYESSTASPLVTFPTTSAYAGYNLPSYEEDSYQGDYNGDYDDDVNYEKRPYSFYYGVKDERSGNDFSRTEDSSGPVTRGSYKVALPDGRVQIVNYVADIDGYKATVTYEGEPVYPDPSFYQQEEAALESNYVDNTGYDFSPTVNRPLYVPSSVIPLVSSSPSVPSSTPGPTNLLQPRAKPIRRRNIRHQSRFQKETNQDRTNRVLVRARGPLPKYPHFEPSSEHDTPDGTKALSNGARSGEDAVSSIPRIPTTAPPATTAYESRRIRPRVTPSSPMGGFTTISPPKVFTTLDPRYSWSEAEEATEETQLYQEPGVTQAFVGPYAAQSYSSSPGEDNPNRDPPVPLSSAYIEPTTYRPSQSTLLSILKKL